MQEWILLIIGLCGGAILSFIVAAYFSDHFHIPLFNSRRRLFPSGKYVYFAPSRGGSSPIVKWDFVVKKRHFFRGSHVTMRTDWTDGAGQRHIWWYEGPIVRHGDLTVARLGVRQFRRSIYKLTDGGGDQSAATPNRDYDPCFIVFHNDTDNWLVRPGTTLGFSESSNCYGGIHVLKKEGANVPDDDIIAIFEGCYFLEYEKMKSRIDKILHSKLRKQG